MLNQTNNLQGSNFNHTSNGVNNNGANIGVMFNILLSHNPSLRLKINEPIKIPIIQTITNPQLQLYIFVGLIFTIVLSKVIASDIKTFLQMFVYIFISIIASAALLINYSMLIISYIQSLTKKGVRDFIKIYDSQIEIYKNDDTVHLFHFTELRQIIIKKNLLIGYTVYLYRQDLLKSIYFNVLDFDEAFAIKDIFDNYITNLNGNNNGNIKN